MEEIRRYKDMKESGLADVKDIPSHWEVRRIKQMYRVVCGSTPSPDEKFWNGEIPWITPADMPVWGSISKGKRSITYDGYESCGTSLVPENSIILSTRAPIGKICIAENEICTNQGCKSLVNFNNTSLYRYVAYFLSAISERLESDGSGTTFKELSTTSLLHEPLLHPSTSEQESIASYLDEKCTLIDEIITATKDTIEDYKKLKASTIYEAVTKGLNPDVKMKDSGVEWIEEIPEDWKVSTISSLYILRSEKVSDKDWEPLSVTKHGILHQLESAAKSDDSDNRKKVIAGDFVINSRSDRRGSCGISPYDGSVSLINTVLEPQANMNSAFYNWLFHTVQFEDEFYKWGRGIVDDLWTTRWTEMKQIFIPYPEITEQQSIAAYLDDRCSQIDSLIAEKESLIKDLEEYKKSLIYECVTGKRKVIPA